MHEDTRTEGTPTVTTRRTGFEFRDWAQPPLFKSFRTHDQTVFINLVLYYLSIRRVA